MTDTSDPGTFDLMDYLGSKHPGHAIDWDAQRTEAELALHRLETTRRAYRALVKSAMLIAEDIDAANRPSQILTAIDELTALRDFISQTASAARF